MGTRSLNIGVLTSSRADFGIYLSLLDRLNKDPFANLQLIVFGTHFSKRHGHTVDEIRSYNLPIAYELETEFLSDSPEGIAATMGACMTRFSRFWGANHEKFDLVFCLGDRMEMFSAVAAALPFGVKFAHIHGGEQTLGAIDNAFRHSISHMSWCHFTSTQHYADRLREMLDIKDRIFTVGSLSLSNISSGDFLSREKVIERFGIDVINPFILITFHPETVDAHKNAEFAIELVEVFNKVKDMQLVINLPNADTEGMTIRNIFLERLGQSKNVTMIESFGRLGYFTMMKHCSFLLGNSSSGIIEAASFGKYVINVGNRQQGRITSGNVIHAVIDQNAILAAIDDVLSRKEYTGENIYYQKDSVDKIMTRVKSLLA
jgi:GDP/UDP-N,N'-diacetylbacillosamine 2-epimerase (hydrolysing)